MAVMNGFYIFSGIKNINICASYVYNLATSITSRM